MTPAPMDLNLADLVGAIAGALPDRGALACDGDRLTYRELMTRSGRVAALLIDAGIGPDEVVGLYMPNSLSYVESMLGCMLARAIPANINYRYTGAELAHLFGIANLSALIVDAEYAGRAAEVAASCPGLRLVVLAGGNDPEAVFAPGVTTAGYAEATGSEPAAAAGRSGDDKLLIFTGGTTGLPKGVLWRHEDFYWSALAGGNHYGPPRTTVAEVVAAAEAMPEAGYLLTAPLMHGAGTYTMFTAFLLGSTVIISRKFDPVNVLSLIGPERVMAVAIVGDAMGRPLADELAAHPHSYDLSSWFILGSGGALLSDSVRDQFQALRPELYITNRFGASETGTDGEFQRDEQGRQRLAVSPTVCVVNEKRERVGAGGTGWLARAGHVPLGYYGDSEATEATFPVIDGVRWAVLGDLARVEDDGTIIVLGRGSTCINSGGEKVFPEEVEQALKAHPSVLDAVVAGIPDDRFGERVAAVVSLRPGATAGGDELREFCRESLAGYKVPARIEFVSSVVRSPTGKADYRWARDTLAAS
ncbi:MAG TPA: AMP-binding protein [Streptosporangiaceae bacterium]|nr:AMP-binding protein [Streptosporangiaceae bacterium]